MGRQTNVAVGAIGAGAVAVGLGAAYFANKYFFGNQGHRQEHRAPRRAASMPTGSYMSVYMPTRTADVILPMRRNGRSTNAYGYMHG